MMEEQLTKLGKWIDKLIVQAKAYHKKLKQEWPKMKDCPESLSPSKWLVKEFEGDKNGR